MITKTLIKEFNLHDDFQDAKSDLINKGIPLAKELHYYVASGGYGDVYKVKGTNKVLKIHQNEFEFETVKKIIDSKKNFDHVCKYYFNRWKEPFYIVVMEYLDPIPMKVDRHLGRFFMSLSVASNEEMAPYEYILKKKEFLNKNNFMEDDIIREYFRTIEDTFDTDLYHIMVSAIHRYSEVYSKGMAHAVLRDIAERKEIQKLFTDVYKGIMELKSIGVHNEDLHEGNVLHDPKTNKYKIIDPMA